MTNYNPSSQDRTKQPSQNKPSADKSQPSRQGQSGVNPQSQRDSERR